MRRSNLERRKEGLPNPLGAHWDGKGTNFALFSSNAIEVEVCLFDESGERELSLRYRSEHTHIDGFRFDPGTILARESAVLEDIRSGAFRRVGRNGTINSAMSCGDFWRAEATVAELVPRISASADLFNHGGRQWQRDAGHELERPFDEMLRNAARRPRSEDGNQKAQPRQNRSDRHEQLRRSCSSSCLTTRRRRILVVADRHQ